MFEIPRQIAPNVYSVHLDILMYQPLEGRLELIEHLEKTLPAGATLIGCILWEYTTPELWINELNVINEKFNLVLVLEDVYRAHSSTFSQIKNVFYYEFSILRTYYEIYVRKTNETNKEWNPNANKFLFLTGKPRSLQRIGLLYRFWKSNLIEQAYWSAFIDDWNYNNCRRFIKIEDQEPFKDWIMENQHSPDTIDPIREHGKIHYRGFPFDPDLYFNSAFRVVSETSMLNDHPVCTEKTYVTILNRIPFIIAGDYGSLQELKDNGFRTYEKYMLIQDYDTIRSPEERIDAVVENTKHFLNTFKLHAPAIKEDTEYNFHVFHQNAKKNEQILQQAMIAAGISGFDIYVAVSMWDARVDTWPDFYYNIKDPSWPSCYNEDNFRDLPEHVQKECIEVFGYKPKN